MQIDILAAELKGWAERRPDVLAAAIVGSYARGTARADSDVDVVLVVEDAADYLENTDWLEQFGHVRTIANEDWGLLQARRTRYTDGSEVEFGITDRRWVSTEPIDPGTAEVVAGGLRIVHDPHGMLRGLLAKLNEENG